MDTKKYLIAAIVVFVVYSALGYLVHNVILAPDYREEALRTSLRGEDPFLRRVPLIYLSNLIFSLAFCFIYARGYEPSKSWTGQGIRYGLVVGTLLVPFAFIAYVAFAIPGTLLMKWLAFGYAHVVLGGLTGAAIYRTEPAG